MVLYFLTVSSSGLFPVSSKYSFMALKDILNAHILINRTQIIIMSIVFIFPFSPFPLPTTQLVSSLLSHHL